MPYPKSPLPFFCLSLSMLVGCVSSSREEQRNALVHRQQAQAAARQGQRELAREEQRKAQEAHQSAREKSVDEATLIPHQTESEDVKTK